MRPLVATHRRRRSILECGHQLGAHHFRDRGRSTDIADRILHRVVRWLLAVVELLTVQIDLKAALTDGSELDADFAITPGDNLGCQTGSLPEVPSRNAVLDLELGFAFSHVVEPPALSLGLNKLIVRGRRLVLSAS